MNKSALALLAGEKQIVRRIGFFFVYLLLIAAKRLPLW